MCAQHSQKKSFLSQPLVLYTLMIVLGILAGLSSNTWLTTIGLLIADIFIRLFKCISLPVISLSIIVTLSSYQADKSMKKIWQRAMTYTFGTTFIAAAISCLLYLLINPKTMAPVFTVKKIVSHGYLGHIQHLIPESFLAPFMEQQVMAVLFLSIIVGIAIRFIPEKEYQENIRVFFKGLHGLLMVITSWIINLIPIGLFGFITSTFVQLRNGMHVHSIGSYLLIIVLANLIQGFIILPLWLKSQGIKPFHTMKKMLPALSVAFFSKSSVGTLPITIEVAEKNLKLNPGISRFVLPLCTSLNMNGCAAFIFTTVVFLMQNHGIELSLAMMVMWVFIATIAAIGNAGVPMGCFFLSASLLASMNIPISLLGIILPFYTIIDMLETSLNVWSDSCVAKVVDAQLIADKEKASSRITTSVSSLRAK